MGKPRIATIVENGKAYTGVVTNVNNHSTGDIITALVTLGASDVMWGKSEPTVTVEVNGEKHSGRKV